MYWIDTIRLIYYFWVKLLISALFSISLMIWVVLSFSTSRTHHFITICRLTHSCSYARSTFLSKLCCTLTFHSYLHQILIRLITCFRFPVLWNLILLNIFAFLHNVSANNSMNINQYIYKNIRYLKLNTISISIFNVNSFNCVIKKYYVSDKFYYESI